MDNTKELETKSVARLLYAYALPAVIGQIIVSIYNIIDRIFLGQCVSELAIAGLAITMPVMNVIHAFGSLVGVGAASRMSIVLGKKDLRWAEKILGNSVVLTIIFGAIFLSIGYLFMDQILALFGASSNTVAYARTYMRIILPGMFFTTLTYNLTGLIRASGYPTRAMLIMAVGAVLNIILDALFVFVFGWGIAGAAWATTITMALTAIASVIHFLVPASFVRFHRHGWRLKWYIVRNVLRIGLSPCLMNFAGSAVVALLNSQLIRYGNMLPYTNGGDLAVGAYGIVNSFASFLLMFCIGLCQGMQPIVGYNYGAGHPARVKKAFTLTAKATVLVGLAGALFSCLFPQLILRIFTSSADLIQIGIPITRYLMIMWGFIGFTIVCNNFFQSVDMPLISIITSLARQVIFLIPLMFLVPMLYTSLGWTGLNGVGAACTISDLCGFALATFFLFRKRAIFGGTYVLPARRSKKEDERESIEACAEEQSHPEQ